MDVFLRWLAERRDIELEPGTELRLEFSSFPSGGLGFVVLLGLAAAIAIVVLAYRRDAHRLLPRQRLGLAALRALAIVATFLLLLEPNLVSVKREVRPGSTVVLVDLSQSMTHRDPYRRAPEIAQAWRRAGVTNPSTAQRIELAEHLVRDRDMGMLRALAEHNDVFVYGFHSGLVPLASVALAERDAELGSQAIEIEPLQPTGRFTNLGLAVRGALERHRSSALAGLIVLSDGRRNLGARASEIARLVEQRRVAHTLVLPVGDPSATQTVRLTRIDAPEKVFQRDPFTVRANVESQGYADVSIVVHLQRETDSGAIETLRSETIRLGEDAPEHLVEFADLRSAEPGVFTYVVEIEPPEFEPATPERHAQRTQIEVLGEKTRVLLVAGGPSHEYRFLRNQLIRDNTVSMSAWLLSADPDFPQDGDIVLERLPDDREALDEFDVFIFVDPDSSKLSEEFCALVAKQVEENGAGLWWACGEIYTLDALRPTASTRPLADILPVVPDVERADHHFGLGRARTTELRWELTPAGALHKAARILDDRDASKQLWAALPGLFVAFPVERTKPGAIVIAECTNPRLQEYGKIPLVATQFYGSGRVLYTGTDDTHRWRALYEQAYNRFWIKGIRHLFEGRLTAGNSRLSLLVDEEKLELGSPQRIVAAVRTETFTPWLGDSYELTIEHEGGTADSLHLAPVEGVPGEYEARFWPTATGFYRVHPAEPIGRPVQASFQVVPAEIEKEGPADVAELGALAAVAGGQLCASPEQLLEAAADIESLAVTDTFSSSHAVWDSWVTIAAVLGLLTLEWLLRKRWNLL